MLYNSLSYLFFFIGVFVVYWSVKDHRTRLAVLLVASWLFYAAWYPAYLALFLAVTAMTYGAGVWLGAWRDRPRSQQRRVVALAVGIDLSMLAFFKYAGFLAQSMVAVDRLAGGNLAAPAMHVVLPLGISFYTFQSIAYVVDVYRGDVAAITNPLKLALFKAFFPQLIAGPIVRATELVPQFTTARRMDPAVLGEGLDLMAIGLLKKVVVADQISIFADRVFAHPDGLSSSVLLLGAYAYAAQIYCDFSGYTDMARGSAKLLGFDLPRNFDAPYTAVNIVDFWRRWHMTLSRWLRDYLYIPLGGSRRGRSRTYLNLIITMLLGGLWHGANWTFVAWGGLHGIGLALTRFAHLRRGVPPEEPLFRWRWYRGLATFATFNFVCLGWILFRSPNFHTAWTIVSGIGGLTRIRATDIGAFGWISLGTTAIALAGAYVVHVLLRYRPSLNPLGTGVLSRGLVYAAVIIAVTLFSSVGSQQFIYFQF